MNGLPPYEQLPRREGLACSWDLWRDGVALGSLNLLTCDTRIAAAGEIRRGAVFSLNSSLAFPAPALFGRSAFSHEVRSDPGSSSQDEVVSEWNTQSSSQWDGFRHVAREGHGFYGGVNEEEHGVDRWCEAGIVGRAVLADVDGWRAQVGRPLRQGTSEPISPTDIVETLDWEGISVQDGDILLVRTGWTTWYCSLGPDGRAALSGAGRLFSPGLAATEETARLLWDMHIAAVASDNPALEAWPVGNGVPLHTRLIPMLGVPIGELFDLESFALDCAQDLRYTGFFCSVPLAIPGGVASPPNAVVIK